MANLSNVDEWVEESTCTSTGAHKAKAPSATEFVNGVDQLNLASLQPGTRAARDQSSYSEWLEVHQRRREQAALAPR